MNYNEKEIKRVQAAFYKQMEWNPKKINPHEFMVSYVWAAAYLQSNGNQSFAVWAVNEIFSEKNMKKVFGN